jgi:hypothetical protein
MYKKFTLMLFSATGALALQATAATAGWTPYGNTNPITSSSSSWRCRSTYPVTNTVGAQVCTVRSPAGKVRGAVIVRNNNSYLYSVRASMTVYYEDEGFRGDFRGSWSCESSGVGANSWAVCFGTEFPSLPNTRYQTSGFANDTNLGMTWPN